MPTRSDTGRARRFAASPPHGRSCRVRDGERRYEGRGRRFGGRMIISARKTAHGLLGFVLVAAAMATAATAAEIDGGNLRLLLLGMQDMNTPQTVMRAD